MALYVVLQCVGSGSGDDVMRGAQRQFWWGSWGDAAHVSPSLYASEQFQLLVWGFGALGAVKIVR